MAINKVAYGNTTLIDLTDTTATAADVANDVYFYTNAGVKTQGTLVYSTITVSSLSPTGGNDGDVWIQI